MNKFNEHKSKTTILDHLDQFTALHTITTFDKLILLSYRPFLIPFVVILKSCDVAGMNKPCINESILSD